MSYFSTGRVLWSYTKSVHRGMAIYPVGVVIVPPILAILVYMLPHMQPALLPSPWHQIVQDECYYQRHCWSRAEDRIEHICAWHGVSYIVLYWRCCTLRCLCSELQESAMKTFCQTSVSILIVQCYNIYGQGGERLNGVQTSLVLRANEQCK